jgi:hypothetical protein
MRISLRQSSIFWIGLAASAFTILLVDPRREVAVNDDWAYALMVQHLLKTGSYQPHDRVVANMPFQIYWASLLAHRLGYSFTSLRISTLALVFLGLIAFYFLTREHQLDDIQAGLIMLALCASPLLFRLSFSFNTDVPFLMCFIIALFLYTRAIRLASYRLVFLASIAASAAILTRQLGLALPAGVFSLWALSKERKGKALFYSIGLILPVVAGGWQLATAALTPTWFQQHDLHWQAVFLADIDRVLSSLFWRPPVILQYLALFSLPLVFPAALVLTHDIRQRRGMKLQALLPGACVFYIVGGVIFGHFANDRPWLLPYLPWEDTLARMSRWQQVGLTLVTIAGGATYTYILALRYSTTRGSGGVPLSERLLDLCMLFLLAEHLFYRTIGDRYLLGFLPFILIVVGRYLGNWLNRWKVAMATVCLAMLLISALWTRELMEAAEAKWMAAESIYATGVERKDIFGSPEWNLYHGAFDDYVREVGDSTVGLSTADFWHRWYPERRDRSQFLIVGSARSPDKDKAEVVGAFPYRDGFFRLRHIYVVKRQRLDQ